MRQRHPIGLHLRLNNPRHRELFKLLASRLHKRPDAVLAAGSDGLTMHPDQAGQHPLHGYIGLAFTHATCEQLKRFPFPVVLHYNQTRDPLLTSVYADNHAIGVMAAEHLLSRGFRRFYFLGRRGMPMSVERAAGFREVLHAAGREMDACYFDDNSAIDSYLQHFCQSKESAVVFCMDDLVASQLLAACRQQSIRVPEQLAIMGVDYNDLVQAAAGMSMTTIQIDLERQATLLLDELFKAIQQEGYEPGHFLVPPKGIIEGETTGYFRPDDPIVGKAIELIHREESDIKESGQLAAILHVSRRVLERHFREAIGRTPGSEIKRARIMRAQQLLRTTRLPVAEIANRCGYEHVRHFTEAFRLQTGVTPARYRREEFG